MSEPWPERIDPLEEPPGIVAHHLKKYDFARSFARGLAVDVACGLGYGTAVLAPPAERAVGLDIDRGALEVARDRYSGERTAFLRADAERLPFPDGVADLVTCFEGIEHFPDPAAHVREVARILGPDGAYLVSTPRAGARGGDPGHPGHPDNPFHLHEFSADELVELLAERFREVRLLGQRRVRSTAHRAAQRIDVLGLRRWAWLRPGARAVSRAMGTAPVEEATIDDFRIDDRLDEALELVAVCRGPRPPRSPRVSHLSHPSHLFR